MRLQKDIVTTDDSDTQYECFNNGYWNGWADIVFTLEQFKAWIDESPYDYRVTDDGIIIYFEDEDII